MFAWPLHIFLFYFITLKPLYCVMSSGMFANGMKKRLAHENSGHKPLYLKSRTKKQDTTPVWLRWDVDHSCGDPLLADQL